MKSKRPPQFEIVVYTLTALCCMAPLLFIVGSSVGFSTSFAIMNILLVPALVLFTCITGYAIYRLRKLKGIDQSAHLEKEVTHD